MFPVRLKTAFMVTIFDIETNFMFKEGLYVSLLDCPQEWTTRNVAKLLLLCGEAICFNFVVSIALNGKMREVANIFVTLSMVC